MELLMANPMARVRRVAEKPAERAISEREHLDVLFAKPWDDFRSYAACMLAASTGMRLGEIRGLLQTAVSLGSGYLDVVTNWIDGQGLKPPKWDSTRHGVPLPARAIETLLKLQSMNPYTAPERFVFWGESEAEPVPKHRLQRDLKEAMKRAKIPPAGRSFHSFRHTYVSLMRSEVGADRVRLAIGHTSTTTTHTKRLRIARS